MGKINDVNASNISFHDIVVTADAAILDSGVEWFDLAGWIMRTRIPEARIVELE